MRSFLAGSEGNTRQYGDKIKKEPSPTTEGNDSITWYRLLGFTLNSTLGPLGMERATGGEGSYCSSQDSAWDVQELVHCDE